MIIYVTENQPALEQSEGNRRLREVVADVIATGYGNHQVHPDELDQQKLFNSVLRRVQREGHSFVTLKEGRRQTATEKESLSKIGIIALQLPRKPIPPETIEEGFLLEEPNEEDYASIDWLAGTQGLEGFDEMILNDELLLDETGTGLIEPFPVNGATTGEVQDDEDMPEKDTDESSGRL